MYRELEGTERSLFVSADVVYNCHMDNNIENLHTGSESESAYAELESSNLLDLDQTIAKELIESMDYPWQVLPYISDHIILLEEVLEGAGYTEIEQDIWIGKNVEINNVSQMKGPLIIGHNSKIGFCANIRGGIIGENCEIGDSEIKNSILFNGVKIPHKSYVGDSILGYKVHLGCGTSCMNLKSVKSPVSVNYGDVKIDTDLRKFGSILGDGVDIGGNSTLNPGTVIGRNTIVYSGALLSGYIPENSIYKSRSLFEIVEKR